MMTDSWITALPILSGLLFYLLLAVTLVYTLVFGYHWYQFGTNRKHVNRAMLIYAVVTIGLLAVIFLSQNYVAG